MYTQFLKRLIDLSVGLTVIVILSPLIALIALLLCFTNFGSPFFTQKRPGRRGEIFKVFKFKTMNDKRDRNNHLLPDKGRLTPIGKFIRATSLDELPQLFNVIKGDMSLVGPRPLLVKYLPLYNEKQARRHEVRPGITGWAQINGRNAISWKEKFDLDVYYVDHLSFAIDVKIIYITIKKVLRKEGINASDYTTMEPFKGN